MAKITLLTGGARSGKSTFGMELALKVPAPRSFLATAIGFDDEMKQRIENHKLERGAEFSTIEESFDIGNVLRSIKGSNVVLIDCLTVWLGNLMYQFEDDIEKTQAIIDSFISAIPSCNFDLVIVTNEVGWGIVPEHKSGRIFRDLAGKVNQRVASLAHDVYLCSCGIPLQIKHLP